MQYLSVEGLAKIDAHMAAMRNVHAARLGGT